MVYCATSGVDVLASRFRLASNKYIVCLYQVMGYLKKLMSNIFFLKYFVINYVLSFMFIMLNEKYFNEKFLLTSNI